MTSTQEAAAYSLQPEEKATPLMVYTQNAMIWGALITKELVRVSTWLRTPTAPSYLRLNDCRMLYATGPAAPESYSELFIPVHEVLAYHMLLPHHDPPDYDPDEPNRKLEPATALVGSYKIEAKLRISTISTVQKYLEVTSEMYTSLYEAVITQPLRANLKPLQAPFVLLRRESAFFVT